MRQKSAERMVIVNLLLKNTNLIDVVNKTVISGMDIAMEEGKITAIGQNITSVWWDTVDCTAQYACPGIIDAHVHLTWDGSSNPVGRDRHEGSYVAIIRAAQNAYASLKSGVTTVRDTGSMDSVATHLAFAINTGVIPGPTVIPCGAAIQSVYGHVPDIGVYADTDGELIKQIRQAKLLLTEKGITHQWVKIMATGGAAGLEEVGPSMYSLEQLELIVAEAHRLHMKVAAHAVSREGIINCVKAGIDSIEHGADTPVEYLQMMKDKGLTLVPTLAIYDILARSEGSIPPLTVAKSKAVVENQKRTFAEALKLGVHIALGTDAGSPNFGPQPAAFQEMLVMEAYGMAKGDVLQSATITAAEFLGLKEKIGSIEEGKDADILLLERNPLADLSAFSNLVRVYQCGREV